MDRMEEYRALQEELEHTPPSLEGTVQRARARRRRERRGWRTFGASFGGIAAVFALFVVLVNVSGPFAAACESIPILKDLAAAVSFSHSLSSAVDHGYVQTIGQSQSDNGVTVDLEYMMLDGGQIVFFGRVDAPEDVTSCMVLADLPADGGGEIRGCGLTSQSITPGELTTLFTIAVDPEEFVFPEVLRLACQVELSRDGGNTAPAPRYEGREERAADAAVAFDVPVDKALLGQSRSVPVDRWIELEGNRFYISSLELYPTSARFTLEAAEDNPDTLQTLSYYLEDEGGNRYESGSASGVLAMGDTYWFESPYFQEPERLTLHITGVTWMEKGRERVTIDLETGEALGLLPEGAAPFVDASTPVLEVGLTAPLGAGSTENHSIHYQVLGHHYYAPDGTEFEINEVSTISGNPRRGPVDETMDERYRGTFTQTIPLRNWAWDTVELELYFSRRSEYSQPLAFPLTSTAP